MAKAIRLSAGAVLLIWAVSPIALASSGEGAGTPVKPDPWQAGFTVVVFLVLVAILGKFAWGPILAALQKREDFIRDSLEQAKKHRAEAEARLKEYSEKVEAAHGEAVVIVDAGRRDAEVVKRKIEDDAKKEAAAMVERAKREISAATDSAIRELYDVSAQLATDAASRIIRKELNVEDHRRLISESIDQLGKIDRN